MSTLAGGAVTAAKGNRAPMNEIYALPVGASSYREALSLGRRVHARTQELLAELSAVPNSRGSFDANGKHIEDCDIPLCARE